jgi:lysophospholipid acyltransferase (LPLAT)-like uncharacterized protein
VIPYPFGRGLFLWGQPIWVLSHATAADLEAKRRELEDTLNKMTEEADGAMQDRHHVST